MSVKSYPHDGTMWNGLHYHLKVKNSGGDSDWRIFVERTVKNYPHDWNEYHSEKKQLYSYLMDLAGNELSGQTITVERGFVF